MHVCGYHIIFEPGPSEYLAYAPALQDLGVVGHSLGEAIRLIEAAVPAYLEDLDDARAAAEALAEGSARPYEELRRELGLEP